MFNVIEKKGAVRAGIFAGILVLFIAFSLIITSQTSFAQQVDPAEEIQVPEDRGAYLNIIKRDADGHAVVGAEMELWRIRIPGWHEWEYDFEQGTYEKNLQEIDPRATSDYVGLVDKWTTTEDVHGVDLNQYFPENPTMDQINYHYHQYDQFAYMIIEKSVPKGYMSSVKRFLDVEPAKYDHGYWVNEYTDDPRENFVYADYIHGQAGNVMTVLDQRAP